MGRNINLTKLKFKSFLVKNGTVLRTQFACPNCKQKRWILKREFKRNGYTGLCKYCSGKRVGKLSIFNDKNKNPNYNGGKWRIHGYIKTKIDKKDNFFVMADTKGYVLEHRLVMARKVGRPLEAYEVVHHKNNKRDDNREENLEIVSPLLNLSYSLYERNN